MPRPEAYSSNRARAWPMSSSVFAWKMRMTGFSVHLKYKQETGLLPSPVESSSRRKLCSKRSSASATAGRIWVLEREAGTHHASHVVDLDAIQVLSAEHVDKH